MKLLSSLLYSLGTTGLFLLMAPAVQAQTGIGNLNPDASSVLDITSTNRGLLIPRVALTGVSDGGTILNPATSLLVYNTSAAIAGPGVYFNSGTSGAPNWERFVSSAAPVGLDFWRTTGNAGTNPATSFLGTTDGQDLAFRVGNIERMRLRQDGTLNLLNALTVGGPAALFSAIVTNGVTVGGTLGVTGATSLAGLSAGATTVNGTLNVSGAPTFGALSGSGNRLVVADASGNLITQSIPAPGDAVLNQTTIDQIASFRITGTGRVGGALSVGSTLGVTGNTTVGGTLNVTGNTGLSTLGTSGLATLNTARVTSLVGSGNRVVITDANGNLITGSAASGTGEFIQNQTAVKQPASFRISGSGEINDGLDVFGKTVVTGDFKVAGRNSVTNLYATIVGNPSEKTFLQVNGDATVTNNTSIGGTLNVTGNTGLSTLSSSGLATLASAIVNGTLNVTGNSTLGTLSAGTATLGSTSLASARVTNLNGTGNRVVVAAADGTLSAASALPGSNNEFISNQTTLQTANFNINGTGRIGSTLNVTGSTALSTLGTSGLATLNSASITTTLGVTGTSNLGVLSAGATTLNSASVTTTLGVTGATTLGNTLAVSGNASLSTLGTSGLATLNTAKVVNLVGTGNRVVVAAADGTLTTATAVGGTSDYIQNQNSSDQVANFRINGTGQIGGTLNVGGTATLAGLNAGATSVSTLGTSGLATLNSAIVANGLSAGATTLNSATVTNALTAGTTTLKSARITDFAATGVPATRLVVTNTNGDLIAGSAVPGSNSEFISNIGTSAIPAFNIAGAGQIGGALTVTGISTLGVLNAGSTTLASLNAGVTTLGSTTLGAAKVSNLNGAGPRVVVAAADGTLTATSTLPGSNGEFIKNQSGSDQIANFQINGTGQIGGTLNVGGTATLAGLNAGATSVSTLATSGLATLNSASVTNGLVVSGTSNLAGLTAVATTLGSARVTGLAASGATSNRLVVTNANGDLIAGSTVPGSNGEFIVNNGGATPSFNISGSGQIGGTLNVTGPSTLGVLSAGTTTLGSASITTTLGVSGTTTLAGLSAGATSLGVLSAGATTVTDLSAGATTLGAAKVTNLNGTGARVVVASADGTLSATSTLPGSNGEFIVNNGGATPSFNISGSGQIGGTLTVTGTSNLGTLNAGTSTLNSATVSTTLGVSGATNLAALTAGPTNLSSTLTVTGTPTFSALGVNQGTRIVVANGSGVLSTQAIPDPGFAIQNQTIGSQTASFNINGSGQLGSSLAVGTTLDVTGAATLNNTLAVAGAATMASNLAVTGNTSLSGNVGIGVAAGTERLTIAGNVLPSADNTFTLGAPTTRWAAVYANNGVFQTSDARLKTNITGLGYGMSTVMAMRPVRYAWKKTPNQPNKIGFIAQELQKVVPEVVSVGSDANQTLGVNYAELVPVLVKALQEQQAQLDTMRGRAEKAEAAVHSFESRLRALEAGTPVNAMAQGQR